MHYYTIKEIFLLSSLNLFVGNKKDRIITKFYCYYFMNTIRSDIFLLAVEFFVFSKIKLPHFFSVYLLFFQYAYRTLHVNKAALLLFKGCLLI